MSQWFVLIVQRNFNLSNKRVLEYLDKITGGKSFGDDMSEIDKIKAADKGIDDSMIDSMVARAEANQIFKSDGVNIDRLARILNHWHSQTTGRSMKEVRNLAVAMASLTAAANGYDALCAGVNRSIGNAFKDEGGPDVPWTTGPLPGSIGDAGDSP